jgi:hypothetical protein
MYRPTVRYDNTFKGYVDDVFAVTKLDRNQILRAALFVAAHTPEFRALLHSYRIGEGNIPIPSWSLSDNHLWRQQSKGESTDDTRVKSERRDGSLPTERIRAVGGAITYTGN